MHLSKSCRIIQRLFVMGGTSAYLSACQPASPPGHHHPAAALAAPDLFRANSGLKPQEYPTPALGLTFLRFAEARLAAQRAELEKTDEAARLCRMVPVRKGLAA